MNKFRRTQRRILGQHFLKSAGVLDKIVRAIDPLPDDFIIEIGPGLGALTFPLAAKAGKVTAVEKDRKYIPLLEEKGQPHLTLLAKDVLDVNFKELIEECGFIYARVKLVGNLPYSISSPLLYKIIEERELFQKCVFLVQKEVAERICAQPGSKSYAPVSILLQIHFSTSLLFTVHPGSFSPPPRVESALIALDKSPSPLYPVSDEQKFLSFLQECFKQRRKTLVNNLIASGKPAAVADKACAELGLDRKIRPEQVSIGQFVGLFDFFHGQSA
ncbi:MAG: 16S rRNA (adenine(1518)-N(6)/adenine(1519)-N(6))-dimethyltransferase RsmA [Candidatus Aminicenantales bacterium]